MSGRLLIYGATGYTGRLIARSTLARGIEPVLAGRSRDRLANTAGMLGIREIRVAELHSDAELDRALADVEVVINVAGPFSRTAAPLVDACLRTATHYLDVTGEVDVMDALSRRDGAARGRGVMLLPGVGFDVVASDCLAAHVAKRARQSSWLALGIKGLVFVSRGSYRTLVEQAGRPTRVRRAGRLVSVAAGSLSRRFDYGGGEVMSRGVSWGDVVSSWHSTKIPDIEVYFEATPAIESMVFARRALGNLFRLRTLQALLKAPAAVMSEGPSESERAAQAAVVVAETGSERTLLARSRLYTSEVYTFTAQAAAAIAAEVLAGHARPGYQTPASLLGPDFVLGLDDVHREDLPVAH